MSTLVKSALLSVGLAAGISFAAYAQAPAVASLPPAEKPAVAPSGAYPGPSVGGQSYNGMGQTQPVTASPAYVGPSIGVGTGHTPPHFEKPADWDQNVALHPYTSGVGPRPN